MLARSVDVSALHLVLACLCASRGALESRRGKACRMTRPGHTDSNEGSDPFDLAYEQQLEVIRHVRRRVKDLENVRARIESQIQRLEKQAAASEAEQGGTTDMQNERAAQDFLSRRPAVGSRIGGLQFQVDLVTGQERNLRATSRRLQEHVERFRSEKELLKASFATADALVAVVDAMNVGPPATSMSDPGSEARDGWTMPTCSFCGKGEHQVERMVRGSDGHTCDEYVEGHD